MSTDTKYLVQWGKDEHSGPHSAKEIRAFRKLGYTVESVREFDCFDTGPIEGEALFDLLGISRRQPTVFPGEEGMGL